MITESELVDLIRAEQNWSLAPEPILRAGQRDRKRRRATITVLAAAALAMAGFGSARLAAVGGSSARLSVAGSASSSPSSGGRVTQGDGALVAVEARQTMPDLGAAEIRPPGQSKGARERRGGHTRDLGRGTGSPSHRVRLWVMVRRLLV